MCLGCHRHSSHIASCIFLDDKCVPFCEYFTKEACHTGNILCGNHPQKRSSLHSCDVLLGLSSALGPLCTDRGLASGERLKSLGKGGWGGSERPQRVGGGGGVKGLRGMKWRGGGGGGDERAKW